MTAATELPLIVGCRYSHFGSLHGRDFAPLRRGFFVRAEPRTLREWYYRPMWVTVCFEGVVLPRGNVWRDFIDRCEFSPALCNRLCGIVSMGLPLSQAAGPL